MTLSDNSFSTVFGAALQGAPATVSGLDPEPSVLPMASWTRVADQEDRALIAHCDGPTLDIGCGPGRLAAALTHQGSLVLGIDVVAEAVRESRRRGASALRRDVFGPVPGEGRWRSVLLADGNIGIGGDPEALLRRARQLLAPGGRVVVEVAPPGVAERRVWATIECDGTVSRPFRWAVVGVDGIGDLVAGTGLRLVSTHRHGTRWCAVAVSPA